MVNCVACSEPNRTAVAFVKLLPVMITDAPSPCDVPDWPTEEITGADTCSKGTSIVSCCPAASGLLNCTSVDVPSTLPNTLTYGVLPSPISTSFNGSATGPLM